MFDWFNWDFFFGSMFGYFVMPLLIEIRFLPGKASVEFSPPRPDNDHWEPGAK